jgi:DoxX-like protein
MKLKKATYNNVEIDNSIHKVGYCVSTHVVHKLNKPRIEHKEPSKILTFLIATVWLANGLLCKVLDFVPRHEQIVARILGNDYSRPLTILIGLSEIVMVIVQIVAFALIIEIFKVVINSGGELY